METRQVPEFVELREERTWIPHRDSIRDVDPEGHWVLYQQQIDDELMAIIAKANGKPLLSLSGWRTAVGPDLRKKYGPHLIPGVLQDLLKLPVRQVYLHDHMVFRIEADGRVTDRLL